MDEFPDDDEFDEIHEDELEVWREMEAAERLNSAKVSTATNATQQVQEETETNIRKHDQLLNNKENNVIKKPVIINNIAVNFPSDMILNKVQKGNNKLLSQSDGKNINNTHLQVEEEKNNYNYQTNDCIDYSAKDILQSMDIDDHRKIDNTISGEFTQSNNNNYFTKKRTFEEAIRRVDELLGPINFDNNNFNQFLKKPRWDNPDEIIKYLSKERTKKNTLSNFESGNSIQLVNYPGVVTKQIPTYNFVSVCRPDNWKRFYIKVKNEGVSFITKPSQIITGLLSDSYDKLKEEANIILREKKKRKHFSSIIQEDAEVQIHGDSELLVDKYRPKKLIDLLSDINVNLTLVRWLKLWDNIVFNKKNVKVKKRGFNKDKDQDEEDELDEKGYPKQKIVILSGPPGSGKSTLAHVAAKHFGYNVIDVNASDDRNPDAFRDVLLSSTQMTSVLGPEKRPNCLILDEIDGATKSSIELLVLFIEGKLKTKRKEDKDQKDREQKGKEPKNKDKYEKCYRPIICICNDIYTPSLRPLKAVALVIAVPPTDPSVLIGRLMTIASEEGLEVDNHTMRQLVEKSGCDIRTCLGALQFMGETNPGENINIGIKNSKVGIFDAWRTIFQIPKQNNAPVTISERIKLVLATISQGETDKLVDGVFHNYVEICTDNVKVIAKSMDWLQFFDVVTTTVYSQQIWSVMLYTNYFFVVWHLNFALPKCPKLNHPTIINENKQKLIKTNAVLTSLQNYSGNDKITLCLDFAPYLPDILNPKLRSVPLKMFTKEEKEEFFKLIDIMLDYGITYIQQKLSDEKYDYVLDPDINFVGTFPDCKKRRMLSYTAKQVLAHELEHTSLKYGSFPFSKNNASDSSVRRTLKPKISATTISKEGGFHPVKKPKKNISVADFVIKKKKTKNPADEVPESLETTRKSCVNFKFKEGYTKVRRKVFIDNIL